MKRITLSLLVALTFMLGAKAQQPELFTAVEIEGWDLSAFDAKVKDAVSKASAPGAGKRERLAAASALRERADFFWGAGQPMFYKFALGDFRHILRFQPTNEEVAERADTIVDIYRSLGRPVPEHGNAKSGERYLVETFELKPKQITFKSGEEFADSETLYAARTAYVYELSAHAGQRLEVRVLTKGNYASVFDLVCDGAGGSPLVSGARRGEYVLPSDGEYLIHVYTTTDGASYEIKVGVKSPDI